MLQDDVNAPFGKVLLGKPVYCSDNMPELAASATAIYYGDMSGLAVKIAEDLEIAVLREKYMTQHATGMLDGWKWIPKSKMSRRLQKWLWLRSNR